MTLSQKFSFEAAHTLNERPICTEEGERMHGHSYFCEITLGGAASNGMIMDSELLQRLGAKVIGKLDHRLLNDVDGLARPTIENIAAWIFQKSQEIVSADIAAVRVWRPSVGDCAIVTLATGCLSRSRRND